MTPTPVRGRLTIGSLLKNRRPGPVATPRGDQRAGVQPCRSPARSALGLCLSLACLALVWHALTLAGWLTSRVTAAQGYLRDVRDLTDLAERPGIREAVRSVVASGALSRLERDVVGRLHVVDDETMSVGVDVSHSGEATWVYRRYQQALRSSSSPGKRDGNKSARLDPGFAPLVVDVGANDGFLSSNSYNLARWGFSTVLVEPNPAMLALAREAQEPMIDPYREGVQRGCYVNAGMAGVEAATTMKLKVGGDVVAMESSLVDVGGASGGGVGKNGRGNDSREQKLAQLRGDGTLNRGKRMAAGLGRGGHRGRRASRVRGGEAVRRPQGLRAPLCGRGGRGRRRAPGVDRRGAQASMDPLRVNAQPDPF